MKGLYKVFGWFLLLPAVLPLIYIDGLLYPYVTPKTLFLRGFGIVSAGIFIFLVFSGERFYWKRLSSKIAWIPGALLAVAFTASALGKDFYRGFWSTFERGDGLLTLATIVLFFYLVLLYADKKFFINLLKITAFVGAFAALYAFFQWIQAGTGIDIPLIEEPRGRFGGTFGNAAFLSGYLGMTLFSALALASQLGNPVSKSKFWRRVAYCGAILQGFVIFLTATRGTILALFVMGIATLIYLARSGELRWRSTARWVLGAIAIFALLFFFFKAQIAKIPFEPVSRLASISLNDSSVSNRLFIWKNLFAEGLKNPLTGYGAENIEVLFNRIYVPGVVAEEWFDRSHNAFLDYFLQYGIAGLLLYMAIIFFLGFLGWKLWGAGDRLGIYFIAVAVVYAIHNFFVFDTAMSLWLLFIFFAASLAMSGRSGSSSFDAFSHASPVGGVIGVVMLFLIIPVFINPLRANKLLIRGYLVHISDAKESVDLMEGGLSLGTYADLEYGYQAYVMYTERQVNMLDGEARMTAYRYAENALADNFKRFPYDVRTAIYLAHVIDLAPPEAEIDEALQKSALDRAIELSPKRIQPWYLLANLSIRKGDSATTKEDKARFYGEAVAVLSEYAKNAPKDAEPSFIIANLYLVVGNKTKAAELAEKGSAIYVESGGSTSSARRAVTYYIGLEEWSKALFFLEDVVSAEPEDLASKYDLAKLYFLTGNRARTNEIVAELRIQKPGLIESDPAFLKALGAN